jgi:hypothetical protein
VESFLKALPPADVTTLSTIQRHFLSVESCYFKLLYLLGAFAKFRKATIGFVMSVRTEQLDFHMSDFDKI